MNYALRRLQNTTRRTNYVTRRILYSMPLYKDSLLYIKVVTPRMKFNSRLKQNTIRMMQNTILRLQNTTRRMNYVTRRMQSPLQIMHDDMQPMKLKPRSMWAKIGINYYGICYFNPLI